LENGMSGDQKRKRSESSSRGKPGEDIQPLKKSGVGEEKPRPQEVRASPPPKTSDLFKRAKSSGMRLEKQAKQHPAFKYSVHLNDEFAALRTPWDPTAQNKTKVGHLGSDDYESGYLSDEGDKFLKSVHRHKDKEIKKVGELPISDSRSRSNREIRTGNKTTTQYHGVPIGFRVDYTQGEDEQWLPHARIDVGGDDQSTKDLAKASKGFESFDKKKQKQFLLGVQGQAPPRKGQSDAYNLGVEFRAVARGSDAFGSLYPAFDGYLMSMPTAPQQVSHLFQHPEFGTGALGSQNAGQQATAEFKGFHEIVAPEPVSHTTQFGTDIEAVAPIRKAKAINAFAPPGREIVTITKQERN
jgi:hypothetical protein